MSMAVYSAGLVRGRTLSVDHGDGSMTVLDLPRWLGPARGADRSLLQRIVNPALDVGCGPGRLVAALAARGCPALGLDIAPAAVRMTQRAGGAAHCGSVFGDVPGAGTWGEALLVDGNIGIGGDPVALLKRCAQLLAPGGRVLVELAPPGSPCGAQQLRLRDEFGAVGRWFPWATVAADAAHRTANDAGLRVLEQWSEADDERDGAAVRWFAGLVRP